MKNPPYEILIVEDNVAHLKLTQYVLLKNKVESNITVVRDGQEAIDYLFKKKIEEGKTELSSPHIILLDLNLPKRDGREVLKLVKEDPVLKSIPVVIVSTSDREEDVTYAYEFGAAGYISKSSDFNKFSYELGNVTQYLAA
jgi:two-component system response regulator